MKFPKLVGLFALTLMLGMFASSVPATAQTVAPFVPTLTAFSIERSIALTGISTTITPAIPASVLASLAGGAVEIRETLGYNPLLNTLTSTVFLVPTGSPLPTPPQAISQSTIIAVATLSVDRIYITSKPSPAIMFVGTETQSTATPYGSYLGAAATVSVGYTTDTPPKITNVIEVIAGSLVLYSASGTGTVTVTQPPTTGGGGGGGGGAAPTVVVNAPAISVGLQARLDASASTDPGGLPLTFVWSPVGTPVATLLSRTGPVIDVQFTNGRGTYTFQVIATNSAGVSSAPMMVSIQYLGH